ncbi:MAG: hypothetical protein IJT73_10680 [Selenomonadaceae bacterium]|nr:hypothetical protein [Selenomonadaceae bacterium]
MKKFITACCLAGLICGNFSVVNADSDTKKNWELQLEYPEENLSGDRQVDNYNGF